MGAAPVAQALFVAHARRRGRPAAEDDALHAGQKVAPRLVAVERIEPDRHGAGGAEATIIARRPQADAATAGQRLDVAIDADAHAGRLGEVEHEGTPFLKVAASGKDAARFDPKKATDSGIISSCAADASKK